jgi:PIN domain nuclease of toxin-antitoxin system
MRLLLDTHVLIWWATDDPRMSQECRLLLADEQNEVFFSSISIWEVAIKHSKGLLKLSPDVLDAGARQNGLQALSFTWLHAQQIAFLPDHHQDPFDRALIAQAMCEPMTLVSKDRWFANYPVNLLTV